MFKNVNLKDALENERQLANDRFALQVAYRAFDILNEEVYREREIQKRIFSTSAVKLANSIHLEESRVFQLSEIKGLCIKYRLRFLEASKFKNALPYEAILKVKKLEQKLGKELSSFRIVAPAESFVLEDCEKDPLLFASMADGSFYLIHQWGKDMHWSRKWLMFPSRNVYTLGSTILSTSLMLALMIPTSFIEHSVSGNAGIARLAFFLWSFIGISSLVACAGLALCKNVSTEEWNSPFFKHAGSRRQSKPL
jgi:hypothetical protein